MIVFFLRLTQAGSAGLQSINKGLKCFLLQTELPNHCITKEISLAIHEAKGSLLDPHYSAGKNRELQHFQLSHCLMIASLEC